MSAYKALLDRIAFSDRSRSIVDHLRWQLRAIFRFAMGNGLIVVNPTMGLSTPRFAKAASEKRVMSRSDVQRALRVLPLRERLIFRLATIEGMRPGQILGLQLQDIAEQSVTVSRRVYEGDGDSPKSGRARVVGLSAGTASLLVEWCSLLQDQRPEAWLFQSESVCSPLIRDNVQRRHIQPKLAKIGLGWVTFQVMRRTNGSLAHKLGIDPKAAADQRGHGGGVAMNEYIQADLEEKLQVARRLDSEVIR